MNKFDRNNIKLHYPQLYKDTIEFVDRGVDILLRTNSDEIYTYEIVNERICLITSNIYELDDQEIKYEFIRQIKYRMMLSGLFQSDLADICGVAQTTVSRYLSGQSIPDVFTANKIAQALGCSIDELIFNPNRYFDLVHF